MRRSLGRIGLVGFLASPGVLDAQTLVTGRVTGSGRPLAGADVTIAPHNLLTQTSDSGTYRLLVPRSGIVVIATRAVGFQPASRRVLLAANDTAVFDFALGAAAQPLDPITVAAPEVVVSARMQAVEERRRSGWGYFFTREQLEKWEHRTLANVLATIGGLNPIPRLSDCGGGYAIAASRSGPPRIQPVKENPCGPEACFSPIFLDGIPYWLPGSRTDPPPDVNRIIRIHDIETIEVYRGEATVPVQFNVSGAGCGVVLLWTRVGGR